MLSDFAKAGQQPRGKNQWGAPPSMALDASKRYTATIETSLGAIEVELLAALAPKTVNNFVFLAMQGFYTNVPFHRVIDGFMIQTGDPTGTGTGGPGYRFEDEPVTTPYRLGTLAMANAGRNTNGSQFFIVQGPSGVRLPPQYTIFGQVTQGMDVVNSIASVTIQHVTVQEA
jgi:cyclophilin family peptidyl-prolyl cis-trans isomerase